MIHHSFFDELKWRGLLYQTTEGAQEALKAGATLYWGFDLTGDSLHIGHLLGIVTLRRALDFGMNVIPMPAGGTTMIGDPSGKDSERPMLPVATIRKYRVLLSRQLRALLPARENRVRIVDNAEWLTKIKFIDFQREVGKFFPINTMLEKDAVKSRIEREQGISFAEFSYQLLQAYDFLVLFEQYGCTIQIAGSDQWGNMVQGVDLIRKKLGKQAFALSWPLIVNPATGKKFGKTESGESVWLDPKKTHPFKFYQFFVNCEDEMARVLMRYFSFKEQRAIEACEAEWDRDRGRRSLQKELAYEMTAFVHGEKHADLARTVSQILFDARLDDLKRSELIFAAHALPHKKQNAQERFSLEAALVDLGLADSKSEARRLVGQRGARDTVLFGRYHVIQKGKREYGIVEIG